MNKKQQPAHKSFSTSPTPAAPRHWQIAVAVVALAASALTGCDRRTDTATGSSAMPASAASR